MAWLGRFQQGDIVPLAIQCQNGSDTPTAPANPPYAKLRGSSGQIERVQMSPVDSFVLTGLFSYPLRVTSSYPAGNYWAVYYYKTSGGFYGLEFDTFSVVAGGDEQGAVIGMYYLTTPFCKYLVEQTEAGSVPLLRRNPSF